MSRMVKIKADIDKQSMVNLSDIMRVLKLGSIKAGLILNTVAKESIKDGVLPIYGFDKHGNQVVREVSRERLYKLYGIPLETQKSPAGTGD